jgi:hypothetical protein
MLMEPYREPGSQIEVEFAMGANPFLVMPVTVVEDTNERISHYLAPGTRYLRRVMRDGSPVPRVVPLDVLRERGSKLVEDEWRGSHWLIVTRPGLAHAVYLKWRASTWEFTGWYVNLQDPLVRTERGFATQDHFLDILVAPDRTWEWKDEDELDEAVLVGRVTQDKAGAIRREGERVVAEVGAGSFPFDDSLIDWRPDPGWPLPELIAGRAGVSGFDGD